MTNKINNYRDFGAASPDALAAETGAWREFLDKEFSKEYFIRLQAFLKDEAEAISTSDGAACKEIFPPANEVFSALKLTPPNKVKAVILGQDPYHGRGQAHGLAFSVKPGITIPKSLQNIYKELQSDSTALKSIHNQDNAANEALQNPISADSSIWQGNLVRWAEQGVLLLNTVLTVRENSAGSHRGRGWEIFTDRILQEIDRFDRPIAFVLWGNDARKKKPLITNPHRLVIESAHPSPLSAHRGFFGSAPFGRINKFLADSGSEPIRWI